MTVRSLNRSERRRRARGGSTRPAWKMLAALGVTVVLAAVVFAIVLSNARNIPKLASEAPILAPIAIGQKAPPFSVTSVQGERLDSIALSKPILLEVFATWCPHCQHEVAALNNLHHRFGERLGIVAVSGSDTGADRTSPESLSDLEGFARYFHAAYPIAYDPGLGVAKRYLQGGFPTIVFIDRKKRIVSIETGEIPLDRLVEDARKAGAAES